MLLTCRPLVADAFAGFGVAWQDHSQFAGPLVGSLLTDMQRLVHADGGATLADARRLLALANSWTAILKSAGPYMTLDWSGELCCIAVKLPHMSYNVHTDGVCVTSYVEPPISHVVLQCCISSLLRPVSYCHSKTLHQVCLCGLRVSPCFDATIAFAAIQQQ